MVARVIIPDHHGHRTDDTQHLPDTKDSDASCRQHHRYGR